VLVFLRVQRTSAQPMLHDRRHKQGHAHRGDAGGHARTLGEGHIRRAARSRERIAQDAALYVHPRIGKSGQTSIYTGNCRVSVSTTCASNVSAALMSSVENDANLWPKGRRRQTAKIAQQPLADLQASNSSLGKARIGGVDSSKVAVR
jgi:hypothetical protein